jgi:hypothetical protein
MVAPEAHASCAEEHLIEDKPLRRRTKSWRPAGGNYKPSLTLPIGLRFTPCPKVSEAFWAQATKCAPVMRSWKVCLVFAVFVVAALACGSSANDVGTGCGGLATCCSMLSGSQAQACEAFVSMNGVTDPACNQALAAIQSGGVCGGGASIDSGAVTGCAELSACCPDLPVAEDPMACLTVAQEGTDEACEESLRTYRAAGYCPAPPAQCPGNVEPEFPDGSCYVTVPPGSAVACVTAGECDFGMYTRAQCLRCQGTVVSACPTSRLIGCCETSPGYGSCYYKGVHDCFVLGDASFDGSDGGDAGCVSAQDFCVASPGPHGTWTEQVPQ